MLCEVSQIRIVMTWEETIKLIRTKPEFEDLVIQAYFHEDLLANVERFKKSEEFTETLNYVRCYAPKAVKILDIGCGNGISSVAFALEGYEVVAVEPDPSTTVGAGAIRYLKHKLGLDNMEVFEAFAEDLNLQHSSFDVVYFRQSMHHAYDLEKFVDNSAKLLKNGGMLFSVRDHVIYDEKDKEWFLEEHPLHKFYGGENAFTSNEYKLAISKAGLNLQNEIKYYDSVINYFPMTTEQFKNSASNAEKDLEMYLMTKIGILGKIRFFKDLYKIKIKFDTTRFKDESLVPGRMYSYIALKP